MKKNNLITLLFILVSYISVAQTTYYVKADGNNSNDGLSEATAFVTIGKAILDATDGDIVNIIGEVPAPDSANINKSITFNGSENATITGNDSGNRLFFINIGGLTITFNDVVFQDNTSNDLSNGSVLNLSAGSTLQINNCVFKNNTSLALSGGAIFVNNANAVLNVSGSTFYNNLSGNSTTTGQGGAICMQNSLATSQAVNCTFFENKIARENRDFGAAVRVNNNGKFTLVNCLVYNNKALSGSGVPSGFNGSALGVLNTTNTLVDYAHNIDTNTASNIAADLTSSNLIFDETLNKVTFSLPASGDDSPIDFGSDGNDAGAWNSEFTLSLDRADFLGSKVNLFFNKSARAIQINHTISEPLSVQVYNILGALMLSEKNVGASKSINANNLQTGVYILVGKTSTQFFSKKFIVE